MDADSGYFLPDQGRFLVSQGYVSQFENPGATGWGEISFVFPAPVAVRPSEAKSGGNPEILGKVNLSI
jgi:hypothetical protein